MSDEDHVEKQKVGLKKAEDVATNFSGNKPNDDRRDDSEGLDKTEGSPDKPTANQKDAGQSFADAKKQS